MATRTWGAGSNSPPVGGWSVAANWTGDVKPQAGDAVVSDATDTANCTLDEATAALLSLTVTAGYSGVLDFADWAVETTGDMVFDGTGTLDFGDSEITCGGNFDWKDQTTVAQGTSHVYLTGTSKTYTTDGSNTLYDLTVSGSYTTSTGDFKWTGALTISGSLVVGDPIVANFASLTLSGTGSLTASGAQNFNCAGAQAKAVTVAAGATFTVGGTCSWQGGNYTIAGSGATLAAGSWELQDTYSNRYFRFGAGEITLAGNVTFNNNGTGTLTVDMATNDASIVFEDNLTLTEGIGLVWSKAATGTVTFDGVTTYTDGTAAVQNLGDVIVADGATLTLASDMECDDLTVGAGCTVSGAYKIYCNGNFVINGTSGSPTTWTDADIQVTGTAVAHYANVTDSDASGGAEIDASDNCNSYGTNTNWDFGAVGFSGPTTYHLGADVTPRTIWKLQPA